MGVFRSPWCENTEIVCLDSAYTHRYTLSACAKNCRELNAELPAWRPWIVSIDQPC